MAKRPAVQGLEARLRRLEDIVSALEREDLELDQALALFEEGIGELRAAEKTLKEGELRIQRLLDVKDGEAVLEPMRNETE
jgi:exodeoxyribonuclease VII small subunit